MSGLTGIIGPHLLEPAAARDVATMLGALAQGSRPGAVRGDHRDDRLAGHVAWTRCDYEPECVAWNERRDVGLIFVGDDYDVDQKAAALRQRGLEPGRAIECLLRYYEAFGADFFTALNGRFAGVLIDRRNETVTLFNDRYGLNRIYVHASARGCFFSTEAKSLLAVLPQTRRVSQQSLAEFFSVGCVLQNRSLFAEISLLPPGSRWTFQRDGSVEKQRYFDPSGWEQQEPLSADEYGARLIDVFGRIAPKYLRSAAPVAMSLTGGLDSRMILAWAGAGAGTLPCYTFGGPYRDCADVRIARDLARLSRQPHTTLPIGPDFFPQFASLAEKTVRATDGAMDVSGAVELYANRLARQIAPVRVTGNYGSEILRANVAFRPGRLDTALFTPEFRRALDEAGDTYRREAAGNRLSFIAFKQVPWHHYARFAAESSELTPRSPFLDNELVALAYRAPRELVGSTAPLLRLIASGNPALDAVGTDRALRSRSTAAGKLAHRWQEFTAKAEYAYDYGMPQWLARADRVLKPLHLERLFLGRHKFYHFRVWYRDQLSSALQSGAFDFSRQPSCYVDGAARQIVREHTSGAANRTLELHKLLSVQLIDRLFTGGTCPS